MAQPYYNQAQGLFNQSAAPISGSQVNNYLNPYAGYVMQNLAEQQGQQMHDLTGRATQAAGGVGADRIGVAQGELGRQQALASGQTLSGIYGSALSAAQQDAQRQQSAAYGIGNLGGAAQNAALQGTQALYGQGAQQQQLNQAQLNAPYQNILQQQAFPYQQAQFLAGITGGLAPALGGTTNSAQQTTAPAPSLWSQLLGAGTAAVGGIGATGGFGESGYLNSMFGSSPSYGGGNMFNSAYGGSAGSPLPGLTANDYGATGGRVGYADGGTVPGGSGMDWMHSDPAIPQVQMQGGQMRYPEVKFSQPQAAKPDSTMGDIANIAKMAMMFASRGGAVTGSPYQAFADGGETQDYLPQDFNSRFVDPGMGELPYGPNFDERFKAAATATPFQRPQQQDFAPRFADAATATQFRPPPQPDVGSPDNPYRLEGSYKDNPDAPGTGTAMAMSAPARIPVTGGEEEPLSPAASRVAAENLKSIPSANAPRPYPEDPAADPSRGFARSPWLALLNAGAGMMAGTSPFAGVNIGKGLQAGVTTLEKQRTEGREDESVNQRAKQLALEAQKHLDTYTKLTPAQAATIEQQQATLEATKPVKLYENPIDGTSIWRNSSGKIEKYGPNGPMPLTAADAANVASKGVNPGTPEPDHPSEAGESAKTAIAPPGGIVANSDPQSMLGSAADPSQDAQRNNEALQGYGTKGAAQQGRAAANIERKDVAKAAVGADRSQFRLQEMKRDLDTIMAYVNKKPNGLAEQALQAAIKPGPGAETAANLANWASKFGAGLPPEVLAAAQTWGKNATLAGFSGIVGEGLSAREAMPIIRASMGAVANINLPEASNRALIASGQQLAQRAKDKQAFFDSYIAKNGGISTGWSEQFEKKFPLGSYIAKAVLSSLPTTEREKLGADTQLLRKRRDEYMEAEKAGNNEALAAARDKYLKVKRGFDGRYGGTSDYFAFGRF